jgi:hypothetical protein
VLAFGRRSGSVSLTGCGTVPRQRRISAVSRRAGLLTAGQHESLQRDGYLLVPSLLDETALAPIRARLDELVCQALAAWDADPGQDVEERGVVHAALGLSGPDFAPCREHPLLAEAAAGALGPDWHLSGLELRAPLPGIPARSATVRPRGWRSPRLSSVAAHRWMMRPRHVAGRPNNHALT